MHHRDFAILLIWLFGADEPPHKGWLMVAERRLRIPCDSIKLMTMKKLPVPDDLATAVLRLVAAYLALPDWSERRACFDAFLVKERLGAATRAALKKAGAKF